MIEKNFVVGSFQCNCRLLVCPTTGEAVLVDPGDEGARLVRELQGISTPSGKAIQIKYLFHTHGHLDHIGATRKVHESYVESKIALHVGDEPLYLNLQMQGQMFGFKYDRPLPVDHYFQDLEEFQVGEMKFSIIHTPGHSPGSVCIRLHENSDAQISETLFSGDTLFKGSIGRSDLWGGNGIQLIKSIKNRILGLDGDMRVCPGHGEDTSIGWEKFQNPFLN